MAIQAVIDMCHQMVGRLAGKVPDEHGECFLILKDMDYVDSDYSIKLKSMAGFRNILTHLYHFVFLVVILVIFLPVFSPGLLVDFLLIF